jgi:hypothetical protein
MAEAGRSSKANRLTAWVVVLSFCLGGLQLAALVTMHRVHGDARFVEAPQLAAALQIFRPSEHPGSSTVVEPADLAPDRSVRTQPTRCAPLTLLATRSVLDARSWTGVSGSPLQPVRLFTVRLPDASTAGAELTTKRMALLRCHHLRLTFPPFDGPVHDFTVSNRHSWLLPGSDHLEYDLDEAGEAYTFYIRRYANTLTWTYGDDSTARVRQKVADDLIGRLREMT